MRDFRTLQVWHKSHELALLVYQASTRIPWHYRSLIDQLQRSALSIASNIAEGCGRLTIPAFRAHMDIAMGSASELEYQWMFAHDLKVLKDKEFEAVNALLIEVKKMQSSYLLKLL